MPKVTRKTDPKLVGRRVKEFRIRREWTQAHLKQGSGVSVRTIKNIEGGGAATPTTLGKLAKALEVDVSQLESEDSPAEKEESLPRFLLQQAFPIALDPNVERLAREGAFADMNGDYEVAVEKFKMAGAHDSSLETHAQLIIRWATSLDNAGQSDDALKELQPLLVRSQYQKLRPKITNWVKYHIAIAKRRAYENDGPNRKQDLADAEKSLRELAVVDDTSQRVAAIHQLGVVYWVKSEKGQRPKEQKRAEKHFKQAMEEWRKASNFREGYALRRLAEIAQTNGDLPEALNLLLDALEVFAKFDAQSYQQAVRAQLENLFEAALAERPTAKRTKKKPR